MALRNQRERREVIDRQKSDGHGTVILCGKNGKPEWTWEGPISKEFADKLVKMTADLVNQSEKEKPHAE